MKTTRVMIVWVLTLAGLPVQGSASLGGSTDLRASHETEAGRSLDLEDAFFPAVRNADHIQPRLPMYAANDADVLPDVVAWDEFAAQSLPRFAANEAGVLPDIVGWNELAAQSFPGFAGEGGWLELPPDGLVHIETGQADILDNGAPIVDANVAELSASGMSEQWEWSKEGPHAFSDLMVRRPTQHLLPTVRYTDTRGGYAPNRVGLRSFRAGNVGGDSIAFKPTISPWGQWHANENAGTSIDPGPAGTADKANDGNSFAFAVLLYVGIPAIVSVLMVGIFVGKSR
ncbi:MAG: hypothetical protein HQ546_04365 [Planctomycetes bacterium]|nr:hypothetical protein [Planctomycetota bacterium]